jgi:hypothetical protein
MKPQPGLSPRVALWLAAALLGGAAAVSSGPQPGATTTQAVTSVDPETKEQLDALGYSSFSEPGASKARSGVTRYDKAQTFDGYNLFTDYSDAAYLVDMHGRVVHTWHFPAGEGGSREFARMLPDGSLLSHGPYLSKQSWNSTELWRHRPEVGDAFSHDLEILEDGSMLLLSTKGLTYNDRPVNMDFIEHVGPDLALRESWSSLAAIDELHRYHPATIFDVKGPELGTTDYYHANTLRVLPATPLGLKDPRFRKGNWMICLREVSLVAIIDKDTKHVVWGWGPGVLDHPHSPVMMPDGQIVVFDNGMNRGYSRLVKMNPATGDITWTYEGSPRGEFFTAERGFCQPLPNGNLLVTLSGKGRVIELNADAHIVWEFYDPDVQLGERRAIYRMVRYPAALVDRLLKRESLPVTTARQRSGPRHPRS